jgi:hypothetical protein
MTIERVSITSGENCQIRGCDESAIWRVTWMKSDVKVFETLELLVGEFNPDAFRKGEGLSHLYQCLMCDKHLSRFGVWA